ncbi:MAG: tyrosine-type recombinase/integrase [Planctomycetota bacterium]|jgi:site-specific recombinase XerC
MRALAAWARELEARSPRTARRYGREARAFGLFAEQARGPFPDGLLAVTPADVRAFVNLDKALSSSSRAVKVAALRSMYAAVEAEGLTEENPAKKVPLGRVESVHHRAVPQAAILRVLSRLANSGKVRDLRDRALVILMLSVGARRAEVAALKVGSIYRTEEGTFLVLPGKGGKTTDMPLKQGAVRAIEKYLDVAGHGDDSDAPLFKNVSRRPAHRGKALTSQGIYHVITRLFGQSPHCLRASAITSVWDNSDGNTGLAALFARHSPSSGVRLTQGVYVQSKKLERAMIYAPDFS